MLWKTPAVAAFTAVWVLAAGLAPAHAQAPPAATQQEEDEEVDFDRGCNDEYGRQLCDQAVWADIVSSFGLEPAERVQQQGFQGVRVFTINGYSNDMPAISILHRGVVKDWDLQDVTLEVRRVAYEDESKAGPAILKREAWSNLVDIMGGLQDLVAESPERRVDEDMLEKTFKDDNGEERTVVSICLHAWVTVTESLTDKGVTRRVRDGCGSDPVFEASYAMSGQALRGFPYCNHLEPDNHRNESTQLSRCFALDGVDRVAAAEVANIFDASLNGVADFEAYLAPDVRLTLSNGKIARGASAVAAALADPKFAEHDIYAARLIGEAGRVTVTGWLDRTVGDDLEFTDTDFVWRRDGAAWRIESITLGAVTLDN